MRKLAKLVFIIALCLAFAACGMPAEVPGSSLTHSATSYATSPDPAAVISITINPAFELLLSEGEAIIDVIAQNPDAETILSSVDVKGLSYTEGLGGILTAAFEEGFLCEGSSISVDVLPLSGSRNWASITDDIIIAFQNQNSISELDVMVATLQPENSEPSLPEDDTEEPSSEPEGVQLSGNESEVVRDDAGNIIKTTEISALGDTETRRYDQTGALISLTVNFNSGGYETITYQNGVPAETIFQAADGTHTVTTHGADGTPVLTSGTKADGTAFTRTHYPSGLPKTEEESRPDGSWATTSYHQNGSVHFTEGEYLRADGALTYFKYIYDESGSLKEYFGVDQEDRPVHITY